MLALVIKFSSWLLNAPKVAHWDFNSSRLFRDSLDFKEFKFAWKLASFQPKGKYWTAQEVSLLYLPVSAFNSLTKLNISLAKL